MRTKTSEIVEVASQKIAVMAPRGRQSLPRSASRLRGGADSKVDEGLYSRQLYVLGHAAQRSLSASAILLIGLSGMRRR